MFKQLLYDYIVATFGDTPISLHKEDPLEDISYRAWHDDGLDTDFTYNVSYWYIYGCQTHRQVDINLSDLLAFQHKQMQELRDTVKKLTEARCPMEQSASCTILGIRCTCGLIKDK